MRFFVADAAMAAPLSALVDTMLLALIYGCFFPQPIMR
jgi:hypothetical protein